MEDAVEDILDGFVHLGGVTDSGWSLKNAGALHILVNDCGQILGLPERILLEPDLKVLVENGDKRHGLLSTTVHQEQEVTNVLSGQELGLGQGVGVNELLRELEGDIELGEGLNDRLLLSTDETLLDTAEDITEQVAVRVVDPALLVLDEEKLDETVDDLLVGHVLKISHATIGLLTEPNLGRERQKQRID